MICGMPTTKKDTRRVVPKREVVRRDRGWRGGVMVERGLKSFFQGGEAEAMLLPFVMDWPADIKRPKQLSED